MKIIFYRRRQSMYDLMAGMPGHIVMSPLDLNQVLFAHPRDVIYVNANLATTGFSAPKGAVPIILDADMMSEAELFQIRARFVRLGREIPE